MIVLIDSHTDERAARPVAQPAPEAGARWGKAARFDFDRTAESEEMERRGGVTLVWPAEHVETVAVADLAPVWRKYDVVRIRSSADPDQAQEATVTREMLIPIGMSTQIYVGGGIGYVEDPGEYGFEERVIHSFVRLHVPSAVPEAELIGTGEEGEWPRFPEELFTPGGGLVPIMPVPGNWDR